MSITALIKEVNNAPVIFNVDNLQDQQNLEALQAIKMPESMATEIFGNNAKYADNTTCVITENPDNAEFPFNVQFDALKIMAKPQTKMKLTDSYLAGIGMPSSNMVHFTVKNGRAYTAPANGYINIYALKSNPSSASILSLHVLNRNEISIYSTEKHDNTSTQAWLNIFMPVSKGYICDLYILNLKNPIGRFIYAKGEI